MYNRNYFNTVIFFVNHYIIQLYIQVAKPQESARAQAPENSCQEKTLTSLISKTASTKRFSCTLASYSQTAPGQYLRGVNDE